MTKLMKQSGFTIIEILVSITILSVLSAVAAPSLAGLINHNKTKAASVLFQDNLRQARYESKTRTRGTIVFCALRVVNKTQCVNNNARKRFSNGWQWFVENSSPPNYLYDAGVDTLLGNTYESHTNEIDIGLIRGSVAPFLPKMFKNRIVYNNGTPTIVKPNGNPFNPARQPEITFKDKAGRISVVYFDRTGKSTLRHY